MYMIWFNTEIGTNSYFSLLGVVLGGHRCHCLSSLFTWTVKSLVHYRNIKVYGNQFGGKSILTWYNVRKPVLFNIGWLKCCYWFFSWCLAVTDKLQTLIIQNKYLTSLWGNLETGRIKYLEFLFISSLSRRCLSSGKPFHCNSQVLRGNLCISTCQSFHHCSMPKYILFLHKRE